MSGSPTDAVSADEASQKPGKRAFGLSEGEFVVPDGFDDPSAEKVLREFEGR